MLPGTAVNITRGKNAGKGGVFVKEYATFMCLVVLDGGNGQAQTFYRSSVTAAIVPIFCNTTNRALPRRRFAKAVRAVAHEEERPGSTEKVTLPGSTEKVTLSSLQKDIEMLKALLYKLERDLAVLTLLDGENHQGPVLCTPIK